eukprot:6584312-Karenia_brevis.AAC.1
MAVTTHAQPQHPQLMAAPWNQQFMGSLCAIEISNRYKELRNNDDDDDDDEKDNNENFPRLTSWVPVERQSQRPKGERWKRGNKTKKGHIHEIARLMDEVTKHEHCTGNPMENKKGNHRDNKMCLDGKHEIAQRTGNPVDNKKGNHRENKMCKG